MSGSSPTNITAKTTRKLNRLALSHKLNSANTISKITDEGEEVVKKLNFLDSINLSSIKNEMKSNLFFMTPHAKNSAAFKEQESSSQKTLNAIMKKADCQPKKMKEFFLINKEINQRIEHSRKEKSLESLLKSAEHRIGELKKSKAEIDDCLTKLSQSISETQFEIEYLTKHNRIAGNKGNINYLIYKELQESLVGTGLKKRRSSICEIPIASNNFRMSDLSSELQSRITQIKKKMEEEHSKSLSSLQSRLSDLKDEKQSLMSELEQIEAELKQFNTSQTKIKDELVSHYHQLIQKGTDTRGVGLIWIIREIYRLGYDVITSCMPNFLDEKAIAYLFIYAQISMEKQKLEDSIAILREDLKLLNQNYFEVEKFRKVKIANLPSLHINKIQACQSSDQVNRFKLKFKSESGNLAINFQDSLEDSQQKGCFLSERKRTEVSTLIKQEEHDKSSVVNVLENLPCKERKNCKTEFSTADLTIPNIKALSTYEKSTIGTETKRQTNPSIQIYKDFDTKQEKVSKFIENQLTSRFTSKDQKKFYLVEKAIRVGIQESEERQLSFKVIESYLQSKQKLNPKSVETIKQIAEKEEKLKSIDLIIVKLKSNEMERISKEFLYYEYLRRFNTDKKTVISALIGEESLYEELLREDREKNVS